jgi:NAD(P)H dehydrogenase (quinone)
VQPEKPGARGYKAAKAQGKQPILLSGLKHYFQDQDRGAFAIGAPNDTVRELTGKDAEDFETVARRRAALPESRQSLRGRLAVLARFLTVPLLPGFNPETYDRAQEYLREGRVCLVMGVCTAASTRS